MKRLKKPVEIHCHMDYNLGVANTIAALQAGASVAQVTITGLGERAGNVPLEDTVMALKTMYGVDLGIKTEKFCETSKFVLDLAQGHDSGQPPDRRRPALPDRIGHRRRLLPQGAREAPARVRAVRAASWSARSRSASSSARTAACPRSRSGAKS